MLSGVFERKLKQLNPRLRVFCGSDPAKPAAIVHLTRDEMEGLVPTGGAERVCNVDKNFVDEFPQWDDRGAIVHSGWRRVLRILIAQKLIKRRDAQRVFGVDLSYGSRKERPLPKGPKRTLIDKYLAPQSIGAM